MQWRDEAFLSRVACPVLVVGAGGIGCELLKNLVLTGFTNIDVIDLDTIDVSNLNRQFLFRREHVGKSKVETAAEAVRALAPNARINCHHDSILSEEYNVDFFQQFKIVIGALDNRAARNHVNRLCLAARVPLIESGSRGYIGQVRTIIRDRTECYECTPKDVQKSYPGCTIRNTPSEPIHCIVWAKHLFSQLFGEVDAENEVSPDLSDEELLGQKAANDEKMAVDEPDEGAADGEGTAGEVAEGGDKSDGNGVHTPNNNANPKESTRQWALNNAYDPKILFRKFFHDDIVYLLSMSNLWKERRKPTPLEWDNLSNQNAGSSRAKPDDDLWTVLECREHFEAALGQLKARLEAGKEGEILIWDKDDEASLNFVVACANLRAHIFNIPMKTSFDIKSMAGNIVPAIATTNAIVAGMIVVEALKMVSGREGTLRDYFLARVPNPRGKILVDEEPPKPNPNCYVCSERREVSVRTNTQLSTVRAIEARFLKAMLHMVAPDVIISGTANIIISSEEEETEAVRGHTLEKVGVVNGTLLECDDFLQKLAIRVRVIHSAQMKADEFEVATDSGDAKSAPSNNGESQEEADVAVSRKRRSSLVDAVDEVAPKRAHLIADGEVAETAADM